MEFCISEKVNNSIATKLCMALLKSREIFLKYSVVHDTIKWLNCAVRYLNMKTNQKLVEKINAQFWSALKWERM